MPQKYPTALRTAICAMYSPRSLCDLMFGTGNPLAHKVLLALYVNGVYSQAVSCYICLIALNIGLHINSIYS